MKILIVDDEPDFVSAIQMRLEANGYGVSTAEDGQQALQKIQFERPDLVILDIQMPDVDGYEVCQRLKADPKYRDIPILVLTARAQKDEIKKAYEAGADICLTKPCNAGHLLEKAEQLLLAQEKTA